MLDHLDLWLNWVLLIRSFSLVPLSIRVFIPPGETELEDSTDGDNDDQGHEEGSEEGLDCIASHLLIHLVVQLVVIFVFTGS